MRGTIPNFQNSSIKYVIKQNLQVFHITYIVQVVYLYLHK